MRIRFALLGGLGLLLIAGAAIAEDTYSLRRTYKAGEVDRYKLVIGIDGTVKGEISLVIKETTKSILASGEVTVESTIESGKMVFGGQDQPFPGVGQTSTTTIDSKTGRTLRTEGGTGGMGITGIARMTRNLGIPDRPVKIGEEIKYESPVGVGKDKVTGTLKVVELEKKSDAISADTIKLKAVAEVPAPGSAGEKMHMEATAWVEPGSGKNLKLEGTATGTVTALGGKATVTIKRTRLAADTK